MNDTTDTGGISRRRLLTFGLLGGVVLATAGGIASLSSAFSSTPAAGFQQLRESDLPLLRSLIPVILDGALPAAAPQAAVEAMLHGLDNSLHHLSPSMLKQSLQLFDLLSMDITRGPATGVWRSWESASREDIQGFLQRWQHSRLALFRQGHAALQQAVLLVWYSLPASWGRCGYPGPPRL